VGGYDTLSQSTVDAVLRLCAKERRGRAALEALQSAERVGLPVDVGMLTTAVSACARKGQLPLAMEVYDRARAQGLAEDPILINALINTCAKAGEVRPCPYRPVCSCSPRSQDPRYSAESRNLNKGGR